MSINFVTDEEKFETTMLKKESIIEMLREKGCRITRQRKILIDIILEEECSCCKEIYFKALRYDSKIGTATVYRMINILEEIGAINRKNTYRIECSPQCRKFKECIVVFDDNQQCCLKEEELGKVIHAGLSACGFIKKQEISKIEIQ